MKRIAVVLGVFVLVSVAVSGLAQEPNLTWKYDPNFAYPVTPTTVFPASLPISLPATLPGNSNTTYWSMVGENNGAASTPAGLGGVYGVDGIDLWTWGTPSVINAGETYYTWDKGPDNIRGGRHTLHIIHDNQDLIAESNENDNAYAHQFVFTPYVLSESTPKWRGPPPNSLGGWDHIPGGSIRDYNCDGFRFTTTGWWNAIVLYSDDDTADNDISLFPPSTGSLNGFTGSTTYSDFLGGWLDAIIVNRNTVGVVDYDIGVTKNYGSSGFTLEQVVSNPAHVGMETTVNLGTDEYLAIWDAWVGDTGWITVAVTDSLARGEDVSVLWLDQTTTEIGISYTSGWGDMALDGELRLSRNITSTGYYGLVLFRHPRDGGAPIELNLRIEPTPPDLVPSGLPGWHSPVVPTPVPVSGAMLPELPDTLYGFAPETYFSFGVLNDSNAGSPGVEVDVYFDGPIGSHFNYLTPPLGPLDIIGFSDQSPVTIPGGRHTLVFEVDNYQSIHEIYENNNLYGEQYCWSPLQLGLGLQHTAPAPGPASGGFDTVPGGTPLYYNCDGYRLPTGYSEFEGVSLTQAPGSDYDLKIHYALEGVKDGFDDNLGGSSHWPGKTDYVVFNNHRLPAMHHDIGVENFQGTAPYTIEAVGSYSLPIPVEGTYGPYTLPISNMLHLFNIYLEADLYAFRLTNASGAADWEMTLHPNNVDYIARQQMLGGGTSDQTGPGDHEWFSETVPGAGYYCLAVCKSDPLSFDQEGVYYLTIMRGVSDVEGEPDLPAATSLAGVHPNPFNPKTTISYELATPSEVALEIFDMKGARVRSLVSGAMPAGRHTATWDGTDEKGRRSASGVYLAIFEAGMHRDVRKMVLVK